MRILALVKYSLDASEIRVHPGTSALRLVNVPQRFGDIDKNVVEAAVQIKESTQGSVGILSVGPMSAVAGLKSVMAMGVDDAVVVEEPFSATADRTVVVRVLEAALRAAESFDLLVCGFASDDGYSWQVGPRLAEHLGLPFVPYVRAVRVTDGGLELDQDYGDRTTTVRCPLPAIVAVAEESFAPRSITLLEAMKAQKRPLSVLKVAEDLGLSVAELRDNQVVREISKRGVVVPRRREILTDQDNQALADRLLDALIEENLLTESS